MEFLKSGENIAALIVGVAMVATLVAKDSQTSKVVDSFGKLFNGAISAAKH